MIVAGLVLLGCWVYCALAIAAAWQYLRRSKLGTGGIGDSPLVRSGDSPLVRSGDGPLVGSGDGPLVGSGDGPLVGSGDSPLVRSGDSPFVRSGDSPAAISILKPLSGLDEGLADNLRSYFEQQYTAFELLFAVRRADDPAIEVVRRLMQEYSARSAELIITGEPPYPHAKVFSLQCMLNRARYDLIAMCDSDVRVGPDFCQRLADEFADPALGLVTCPYRAVAGSSVWSQLEAVGMNTDFHAGLFTAVMMEGTKFAVGPTIVARKLVLTALGGMERVKDYLAEDYMLGRLAFELGCGVRLSSYVVEHHIGSERMQENFAHRIRWARSSRRSRPWGYVGQFFTHTLPICLGLYCLFPFHWTILLVTVALRTMLAWLVAKRILKATMAWHLLPLQDLLGFAFWIAGFFGNSIMWRGQRYMLKRDGTMELAR